MILKEIRGEIRGEVHICCFEADKVSEATPSLPTGEEEEEEEEEDILSVKTRPVNVPVKSTSQSRKNP